MLTNQILWILIPITFCIFIYTVVELFKLKDILEKQNLKSLNLYLNKRFVSKLLTVCLEIEETNRLRSIIQEIIHYFCLDFVALNVSNHDKVISFHNNTTKKHFTTTEVRKYFKYINNIKVPVGDMYIDAEDHRKLVGFKHNELTMVVALETNHTLQLEEKEILGNEIMQLIKLPIFSTLNKTPNLIRAS